MTMISPILPFYIQDLGITDSDAVKVWAGIIFASTFVTQFIFQPLWGKWSDRFGHKRMLLRSVLGDCIVIMLMGFAPNIWILLILRLAMGVVTGFKPAAIAIITQITPKEKAGWTIGILQSVSMAGIILGPVVSGILYSWFDYSQIFLFTGILLFIAFIAAVVLIKEPAFTSDRVSQANQSLRQGWKNLKKVKLMPVLFSITAITQFSLICLGPQIPLFIQEMHGNHVNLAFYAGLVLSSVSLSNMVASPFLGKLSDRYGAHKVLIYCLFGSALLQLPGVIAVNVWQLLAARFMLGFFLGGLIPSVHTLIRKYVPKGMEGSAYGFNQSAFSLGMVGGSVLGGLLGSLITIRGMFVLSSILLFIVFVWVKKVFNHNNVYGVTTPVTKPTQENSI